MRSLLFSASVLAAVVWSASSAQALSIKEFRKYPAERQATYISGAVSMLAYSYAAGGDTAKARCVQNWYFGALKGDETPGAHELALELAVAENRDAEKYHVEGIILGLTDKTCSNVQPSSSKR